MNTTENNKIIAEFMGKKELIKESQFLAMEHKAHNPTIIEYLKYDTDWNWLVEVVEKIFTVEESIQDDLIFKLNDALLEVNKNSLYNACLNCIKWYNEQK